MVEQLPFKEMVVGSSPTGGTRIKPNLCLVLAYEFLHVRVLVPVAAMCSSFRNKGEHREAGSQVLSRFKCGAREYT